MSVVTELQGLFSPQAVAASFERQAPLETTIINTLFPKQTEHPFVHIGISELAAVVGTQAVVRRDGMPIPFQGPGDDVNLFAPRPIKPSVDIKASEINDLKAIWGNKISRQQFVDRKVNQLRVLVRNTTEGMASVVASTGKLSWPSRLDSGAFENYELDFGGLQRLDLPVKWSDANKPTLKAVYRHFSQLKKAVSKAGGGGGKFKILAGEEAFEALAGFGEEWKSTAEGGPVKFELESGGMLIGGYQVKEIAEDYQSPIDESWVPKIPPKAIIGYASQNTGEIFYLSIDSISNNGQPTPFYVVLEQKPGDAAVSLIGQAKPVPATNLKSLIISEIV